MDALDSVAPQMKVIDTGGYRVHGTDSPWSIGSSQSHGCVRLLNKEAKRLSNTLKMYVGTTTRGQTPNGPVHQSGPPREACPPVVIAHRRDRRVRRGFGFPFISLRSALYSHSKALVL